MSWKSGALLLLLTTLLSGAARAQTFSTSVTATPGWAAQGETLTLTSSVTSSDTMPVRIQVQIYDPNFALVHSALFENQALTAGVAHTNTFTWTVPANEPLGTHYTMVGIYSMSTDWSPQYHWNSDAGRFTVGAEPVTYTSSATVSPSSTPAGEPVDITATVQSSQTEQVLVDVEVYDASSDQVVFQRIYDNQTLTAGVSRQYAMTWQVPESMAAGTYSVRVGLFGPNWSSSKHWNGSAAQVSIQPLRYSGSATTQPTAVSDGSTLSISARLTSLQASTGLVRVEVRNPSGTVVHSQSFANQSFTADETRSYPVTWVVPAQLPVGYYQVGVSVHTPDGSTRLYERTQLARFTLGRRPALDSRLPEHFTISSGAPLNDAGTALEWMPETSIPFDHAFWYLSGGVQTGWASWGYGNGQWVKAYAQAADLNGQVPLFSYYQLLQSAAPCTVCNESYKDLSTLNTPSIMDDYYRDFILLMKRLSANTHDGIAGFGKQAIVHIEPDLSAYAMLAVNDPAWCHGYCTGVGNDPSLLSASVASSGVPELAGYPNTYAGFNQALLHLRDLYAPNVLLAIHLTAWGNSEDITSDPSPTLDAWALGLKAGHFAALSGVVQTAPSTSTYDLVFNDVIDRDAWYQANVENQPAGAWWDATNQTFPNFHRWEQFLSGALQEANKPALVWQIPLGNQYYQTMDNTPKHYQDNRITYFFDHIEEVARIGVIGLSFSPGEQNQTAPWNADGQQAPYNSTCATAGSNPPPHCAWQPSTVTDDDGGYLRLRAQGYYTGPLSLTHL